MLKPNKDKTVIITGASGGIGKIIAFEFAKKGYKLILISRNLKKLKKTQNEIKTIASNCKIFSLNVTDYPKIKEVFKNNLIKGYYVLINAAGVIKPIGPFENNNITEWTECIRTNLMGTANIIHAALPYMDHPNGGTIINFSGGGAFYSRPNFTAYSTSKSAIVRFTESLASELSIKNIRVHAVSPGAINTKLFTDMLEAGQKNINKNDWKNLQKQKETGGENPKITAELCLWLDSPASKPLTGKGISAIYDKWKSWTKIKIKFLVKNSWYSMRRIDPYTIDRLPKI